MGIRVGLTDIRSLRMIDVSHSVENNEGKHFVAVADTDEWGSGFLDLSIPGCEL